MKVSDIMTPRVVLTVANIDETVGQIMKRIPILIHGRMPVTGNNIDNVSGMVLRSEILRNAAADNFDIKMKDLSRAALSCSVDDSVDRALDVLLENKEQLLIAKDEFGGTAGIVTMEDIIETFIGLEITDENDEIIDMQKYAKKRWKKRQEKQNRFNNI